MATISETTGEDRIAELKRKMQESAKRTKAEHETAQAEGEPAAEAKPVAVAQEPTVTVAEEPTAPVAESNGAVAAPAASTATTASVAAAPVAADTGVAESTEEDAEARAQAEMTRREFLTYTWGAALGLLTIETGLMSYFFMYPRFRAGEFGGQFFLSQTDIPSTEAAPVPETSGKFWLVSTEEGPRALYMVCTHLGCLYKWEASNNRFECPCHGSKFTKEGLFIEGPAPRSLDMFEITEENAQVIVDTGRKIVGTPAVESPARIITA